MQKIINQILEGNFDYENGSLDFSCTKIELSIEKGQTVEGSFHIYGAPGMFTSGTVISSDWRMECLNAEFIGIDEEISFCFHGETLEEGEVVKGNFYIISNHGEYYIPFVVMVEHSVLESSIGGIKNLFHFANLAKSNWQEAVRLFYSPEFIRIFSGSDAQYEEDYRALSAHKGSEQNLEEFLIQISKKQKVEFLVEEKSIDVELSVYDMSYTMFERELSIVRNGWGFTQLFVECSGEFLFTEKTVLTDDDFLGTRCNLQVYIDAGLCRKGKNYGEVCLFNPYMTLRIPVVVKAGEVNVLTNHELAKKRCVVQMMEFYEAFRMKKIGTGTWLKETGKLVDKLLSLDEKDMAARLFQAQLLITEERMNEAGWILDKVADEFEKKQADDTLYAYYLYLNTLVHGDVDYMVRVTSRVEHIYRQDNSNWRVGWLLLYLSEEYHKSATSKWVFLEKQFRAGCTSPMIYIEALILLNNNPALLRRLGQFELQILHFGAKREFLKPEVVEQMLYLVSKMKEYSEVLFQTLKKLYEKRQDGRILQEICTLLIKGGCAGVRYFEWYHAGVSMQLRITNLYEYYMMSMDMNEEQEIPKVVLMYFSYQNNMDYIHSAYLYDYILQHKDKLKEIYEAYRIKIEHFVLEQIGKGHINRHLANIYNHMLEHEMVREQNCSILSEILFAHLIRVEDDRLRKIYVYHQGIKNPKEYNITNGCAWVSLYGREYTIVFEDAWNNRFIKNIEYTTERLMMPAKYLQWLLPFDCSNVLLDLYMCDAERAEREPEAQNIARAIRLVEGDATCDSVKKDLYLRILQYFYENDENGRLNEYLYRISPEMFPGRERSDILRYAMLSGNYDMAITWLEKFGPYFVDTKLLVRMIVPLMERKNMEADRMLLSAAAYVFRKGKYDSTILDYLSRYYKGMTRSMRDIWKAVRSYGLECYDLSERILVQMLYSGAFVGEKMEIFRYYVSQGAKPEVEEALLAQCAYDYFVRERVTEQEVFEEIRKMNLRGENVQRICKLAYLKNYSENKAAGEILDDMAAGFLEELFAEGIRLEFFKEFKECEFVQRELADRTIIEYHSSPGTRACIHYVILRDNGESEDYVAEYMKEAYSCVFFKEFVLFFGESLQYYITEEKDGIEQLTESGNLQKSDISHDEEETKYRIINDIVISKNLQDFETMDNLLEEYYRREFLNSRLFELR